VSHSIVIENSSDPADVSASLSFRPPSSIVPTVSLNHHRSLRLTSLVPFRPQFSNYYESGSFVVVDSSCSDRCGSSVE
jgi:hypothetical protein